MKRVEGWRSFLLWNVGNNPWSKILMHFSALTFPSQTTSSESPAVQMAHQTITEKSPNWTAGCRYCKENSWDGSRQTQIWDLTAVRKLRKPGLIKDNSISKLQSLAYNLWPSSLSAFNVGRVKWLSYSSSTTISKGMEIADKSSWILLNHFGHISYSCWRIVSQISWQHGKSSELAVDDQGVVKCFSCLHSWIAPTLSSLWRAESWGFLLSAADLNQLVIAQ